MLAIAPELIVVMPVYNEREVITRVAAEWLEMLDGLEVPYRLLLRNDGSRDDTAEVLDALSHPSLEVAHAPNRGHGPTILRACREAAARAPWVFQTDSDGELPASAFPAFWAEREKADLLIGTRIDRESPWSRRLITAVLRLLLRVLFGKGITDGNCPYRLMRAKAFQPLFAALPEDTFAPNVLVSGFALRQGLRILERPVPHRNRTTGVCSIRKLKLLRTALKAARQTLAYRFTRP